jgi:hypothetical protein
LQDRAVPLNVDHIGGANLDLLQGLSDDIELVAVLDQVALDCAQKQKSAFTELGLTP